MRAMLVAVALGLALPAAAGERPTKEAEKAARALAEEGMAHYNRGEYDEAIVDFRAADAKVHSSLLVYNIAQAYRLKGDCAAALKEYEAYLAEEAGTPRRQKIQTWIAEMRACAKEQPPPPPPESQPASRPVEPPQSRPVVVPPPPPPPHQPPPPRRRSGRTLRLVGLATGGAGLVAGGVAGFYALRARSASNEVASFIESGGGVWDRHYQEVEARGQRASTMALVTGSAGAVLVAGGVTLYLIGSMTHEAPRVSVAPVRGGASVWWACEF